MQIAAAVGALMNQNRYYLWFSIAGKPLNPQLVMSEISFRLAAYMARRATGVLPPDIPRFQKPRPDMWVLSGPAGVAAISLVSGVAASPENCTVLSGAPCRFCGQPMLRRWPNQLYCDAICRASWHDARRHNPERANEQS